MTIPGFLALALALAEQSNGSRPAKKNVLIGPDDKTIRDFLKRAPDVDRAVTDTKIINDTTALCNFLATTRYEKVFALYHGYSTGLTLNEAVGTTPTFQSILAILQPMTITSTIKELEFFSCLAGNNANPLFQIARLLKTKIIAMTFLRARNDMKFRAVDDIVLKNLDRFRNYIVLGTRDPDIKTFLRNHANTLVYQYFFPIGFDTFGTQLTSIDFAKMTAEQVYEKILDAQNSRQWSLADATAVTISDLTAATNKQTDYQSPQFTLFEKIEFLGE